MGGLGGRNGERFPRWLGGGGGNLFPPNHPTGTEEGGEGDDL